MLCSVKKEKRKFWIALSCEEIKEDIFVMTSPKPARRPRKQPKNEVAKGLGQKKQNQGDNCFVCSKPEHVKKKCTKYHAWRAKKGIFLTLF